MKKIMLLTIGLILAFNVFADADKGQKYYLKYMRPYLEINGQDFAGTYLKVEWKRMFKKDAKRFIKKYSKKYPDAKDYFHSDEFQKIAPHIEDFVIKYAADSGELASCN